MISASGCGDFGDMCSLLRSVNKIDLMNMNIYMVNDIHNQVITCVRSSTRTLRVTAGWPWSVGGAFHVEMLQSCV